MKYIHTLNMDYWWAIHSIGEYTPQANAGELEIWLKDTADRWGAHFFDFRLYNLPYLDQMIAGSEYMEKDDPRYDLFIERRDALEAGTTDYFIGSLYYDFTVLGGLNDKTVFDVKNESNTKPFFGTLFIRETEPLFPNTVIGWMERLSMELFGERFKFAFADSDIYSSNLALRAYRKHIEGDEQK